MKTNIIIAMVLSILNACDAKHAQSDPAQSDPDAHNFFQAATQVRAQYPKFEGYESLENQSELVVIGKALSLAKGAVWRFEYDNLDLGEGHSNTTVMRFRVDETIKGESAKIIYISFPTGLSNGETAPVPTETLKIYLEQVDWLDHPEIEQPRRGVSGNTDPIYRVIRPEGLINIDAGSQPLTIPGKPLAPTEKAGDDFEPKEASGEIPIATPESE